MSDFDDLSGKFEAPLTGEDSAASCKEGSAPTTTLRPESEPDTSDEFSEITPVIAVLSAESVVTSAPEASPEDSFLFFVKDIFEGLDEVESSSGHPIVIAINKAKSHLTDARECLEFLIPQVKNLVTKKSQALSEHIRSELLALEKDTDESHKMSLLLHNIHSLKRLGSNRYAAVLRESLFNNIFAIYDVFTGDLIKAIFAKKPELFKKVNRSVEFSDILRINDIEKIKAEMVDAEVEALRRKSYVEQFAHLEKMFGVTLTKFDTWPNFVEAGQRRNLMTHCGGIISDQYLDTCRDAGVAVPASFKRGDRIPLDTGYVEQTIEIVLTVCVMLGQTIWRKTCTTPDEYETASKQLISLTYSFLQDERWNLAAMIASFAMAPTLQRQNPERDNRMIAVNRAIALKAIGQAQAAKDVMATFDWSVVSHEFQLAEAILIGKYQDASRIMRRIGKNSELISRTAYSVWPLFRDFRDTQEFAEAYLELFGFPFGTGPVEPDVDHPI